MSRRNGAKPDLKLNLSPPRVESPSRAATVSPTSPPSSCVSSEMDINTNSGETTTSMVLVGCPRCLMYIILSEEDPKCPKCKNTVLLDFLHETTTTGSASTRKNS
ncbi:hypothetical protein F3Y22_tig00005939pilonHSYRG00186 [Hibiscus syriacus]|uniref:GIR1-like zinc ribbon domain-containing protein n=1 Tax=Hibiscus syriacus TaxID=106335 RepID=A0A6A3CCP2_HIBSY|nr:uncharacterized protein LOC120200321 [Hibiscus syriacus]KAE8726960.1 hypothetical protein F3Y22_tig00005939pilonHSYRG00186 [Hibiscus syriacus]